MEQGRRTASGITWRYFLFWVDSDIHLFKELFVSSASPSGSTLGHASICNSKLWFRPWSSYSGKSQNSIPGDVYACNSSLFKDPSYQHPISEYGPWYQLHTTPGVCIRKKVIGITDGCAVPVPAARYHWHGNNSYGSLFRRFLRYNCFIFLSWAFYCS